MAMAAQQSGLRKVSAMPDDLPIKIVVMGLGYIGLPSAALMARSGGEVLGVDVQTQIVDIINAGAVHIEEADLADLVRAMVRTGRLRAAVQPEPADVFVVAVPTPLMGNNEPDLSHVRAAATAIAPHLRAGNLVLLESTVPVGATEGLRDDLARLRPDLGFAGGGRAPLIFLLPIAQSGYCRAAYWRNWSPMIGALAG
jgi:UDP-N-acetyl-D-mannosaminuronic acid dehydrogenase